MSKQIHLEILQVMNVQTGHDEIKFDPTDPEDVNRVKEEIKQKLKKGWMLCYGKKGDKVLKMATDPNIIDDPEFNRFFLKPGMKRMLKQPIGTG